MRSGGSLGGNSADNIQIGEDNTTITGSATSGGFCGKNNVYTVYFAMKFSKPFTSFGTWDGYSVFPEEHSAYSSYQGSSGGYVEFPAGSELEVRTALSYVDVDGARKNLDEAAESFDDVRAAASTQWNTALSRIKVAGFDEDDIVTFYSALYHSLLNPNVFNDADGRYIGFDGDIHTVAEGIPSTPTSPTGTPTAVLRACRGWSFRSRPATWPSRWSTTPSRAGRFRGGRWPIRRPPR